MKALFKKKVLIPLIVVALLFAFFINKGGDDSTATLNHTVTRGDFVISIVEGGTLQAVNEVVVKNTIDGDSRIIWL
ncbi:hypothetical protein OAG23_01415, partial [bacterium]|nr:hypothetical protein [bacterium]